METKLKKRRRWGRIALWVLAILYALLAIGGLVADRYYQFRKTDAEINRVFAAQGISASVHYYTTHGRRLRYIQSGDERKPALLFLHGSPGSISFYSGRFGDKDIAKNFFALAVERPGYGFSGFGEPEPSIEKQAAMIRPLLDSLHHVHHPVIVVGSSYGSSVACRLAMDHPELVDGLVLTGPSLGPGREKMFWFTPAIETPVFRWFIPRALRSANTEKYHHREELEKMLPYWGKIRVPVAYLQGENDNIIDTSNAGFARTHLVNVPSLDIRFLRHRRHLLAQYEWPAIRKAIMDVYDKAKGAHGSEWVRMGAERLAP